MAIITGTAGADVLISGLASDRLLGLTGNDTLYGGGGQDTLDGGAGADRLFGGQGNDTYIVDSQADRITESAGPGIDTVLASVTFSLAAASYANVENLKLLGGGDLNGTGNASVNRISGNSGSNKLFGVAGNDSLDGGAGNDTLTGGVGSDSLFGNTGNDILIWDKADTKVNGGGGTDILRLADNSLLDLTAVANSRVSGIEVINLAGNNTLTLDKGDVSDISFSTNTLRVVGGAGDAVVGKGFWVRIGDAEVGGQTYAQYVAAVLTHEVVLQVDLDVDRGGFDAVGLSITGAPGAALGGGIASAGDVNGDGYDDFILHVATSQYVVFGGASGISPGFSTSSLDGTNSVRLSGFGRAKSAGDINGDGFDDIIAGDRDADAPGNNSGIGHVVFGRSDFSPSLATSALNGTNGFVINGAAENDRLGDSVSPAGDLNGDGLADFIISAFGAEFEGSSTGTGYVVFGRATGFGSSLDISSLDETTGFSMDGSASFIGDVNGDGHTDMLVARPGEGQGSVYVVLGSASGFDPGLELSALDGTNGFKLSGGAEMVAGPGDINGDGFADVITGSFGGRGYIGPAYVLFGKESGFTPEISVSALDGTNGFSISGMEGGIEYYNSSIASVGDVNGDGLDDIVLGSTTARGGGYQAYSGVSYLVFGRRAGPDADIGVGGGPEDGSVRLPGVGTGASSGRGTAAGDIDGDGYYDIMISATGSDRGGSNSGEVYVVFGRDYTGAVTHEGTAAAETLTGSDTANYFVSGQGDDTIAGLGGADVVRAGAGDDRIEISDAAFFDLDAGSGTDTLALAQAFELDLTTIADTKTTGIEVVDLNAGSGPHALKLSLTDLLNLSGTSNVLTVEGGGADAVEVTTGEWIDGDVVGDYHVYTLGAATLKIHTGITDVAIAIDAS